MAVAEGTEVERVVMCLEVLLGVIDVEVRHGMNCHISSINVAASHSLFRCCGFDSGSGTGVRGGRNSERKAEANADDLDKDLEAYLKVS